MELGGIFMKLNSDNQNWFKNENESFSRIGNDGQELEASRKATSEWGNNGEYFRAEHGKSNVSEFLETIVF